MKAPLQIESGFIVDAEGIDVAEIFLPLNGGGREAGDQIVAAVNFAAIYDLTAIMSLLSHALAAADELQLAVNCKWHIHPRYTEQARKAAERLYAALAETVKNTPGPTGSSEPTPRGISGNGTGQH